MVANRLVASKSLQPELTAANEKAADASPGLRSEDQSIYTPDSPPKPDAGGRSDRGSDRYVQFAFLKPTFYMELPNRTLFPAEARRLFRDRSGFFYLHQRRWWFLTLEGWRRLIYRWNPVQKEYLNADTRSAAEDMAFTLYTLWKFPLDWQFYFRAARFSGGKKRGWEGVGPVVDSGPAR